MLPYLTLTYLLSLAGIAVYFLFIKGKSAPVYRKQFLYFVVAMSFSLPALFLYLFSINSPIQSYHAVFEQQPLFGEYAQELEVCYKKAASEADFCKCDELEQTSIILYKKSAWYETALGYKSGILILAGGSTGIILLWLAVRLLFLVRLIRRSEKELRWVDGKPYYLLYDSKNEILAASFRLGKSYILWKPALNQLESTEQESILYHEIAHLENRDTWEQIGMTFLQIFWLLNPVFYALKRELHLLNEFLADAFAIQKTGSDRAYAALLIRMKEQQQFGLVNMFGTHPLKSRILQITQPAQPARRHTLHILIALVLMISTGFATTPLLNKQQQAFFEYELVQREYLKTGKTYFCKTCLYEQAGESCLPE